MTNDITFTAQAYIRTHITASEIEMAAKDGNALVGVDSDERKIAMLKAVARKLASETIGKASIVKDFHNLTPSLDRVNWEKLLWKLEFRCEYCGHEMKMVGDELLCIYCEL